MAAAALLVGGVDGACDHRARSGRVLPGLRAAGRAGQGARGAHLRSSGGRAAAVTWHKRRFCCANQGCKRQAFAESGPLVRAGAAVSEPGRTTMGHLIGDQCIS